MGLATTISNLRILLSAVLNFGLIMVSPRWTFGFHIMDDGVHASDGVTFGLKLLAMQSLSGIFAYGIDARGRRVEA